MMKQVLVLLALSSLLLGIFAHGDGKQWENNHENGAGAGRHHHGQHYDNKENVTLEAPPTPPTVPVPESLDGLNKPINESVIEHDKNSSHHHGHHGEGYSRRCAWTNARGIRYDLNKVRTDLFFKHPDFDLWLYPCHMPAETEGVTCAPNSTVCIKKDKDAITFGNDQQLQFADAANGSIEVSYGGGELCSNGVPRKAIVVYTCSQLSTRITSVESDADECFLQINVELYGKDCPIVAATDCHGLPPPRHHRSNLFTVLMFSSMAILMSFFICFALCACRRSRRLRAARTQAVKKASKKVPAIPYEAVPLQLIPGGFAPVDPYTLQGYPMIPLVAPTQAPVKGESV